MAEAFLLPSGRDLWKHPSPDLGLGNCPNYQHPPRRFLDSLPPDQAILSQTVTGRHAWSGRKWARIEYWLAQGGFAEGLAAMAAAREGGSFGAWKEGLAGSAPACAGGVRVFVMLGFGMRGIVQRTSRPSAKSRRSTTEPRPLPRVNRHGRRETGASSYPSTATFSSTWKSTPRKRWCPVGG